MNPDQDRQTRALAVGILLGGKSRRFGSPKALARLAEDRLVDLALRLARQISQEVFLLTGNQPPPPALDLPCFPDLFAGCGPMAGIHSALCHSPREWVAILPCDMPLLQRKVFLCLARYCSEARPIVARSHQGLEPLVSLWPTSWQGELEAALRSGTLALHVWLKRWPVCIVDLPAQLPDYREEWFWNVNYPRDLQNLQQWLARKNEERQNPDR